MATRQLQRLDLTARQARQAPGRSSSVLRLLAQVVLIATIVPAPWLLGGVEARVQVWLFAGVLVACVLCWLAIVRGKVAGVLPTATIPLFCAIGLGFFQLVPLPDGVRRILSPRGAQLYDEFLPSLDQGASADAAEALDARCDP